MAEIHRIHAIPRLSTYGSPRVPKELVKFGWKCCENTVAKRMRKVGIRAATAMKFKAMATDSKHADPIAPNRLDQDFTAKKPNLVWLTDFTYVPIREGFTYLCTLQDLFSRRIVGWSPRRSDADRIAAMNGDREGEDFISRLCWWIPREPQQRGKNQPIPKTDSLLTLCGEFHSRLMEGEYSKEAALFRNMGRKRIVRISRSTVL